MAQVVIITTCGVLQNRFDCKVTGLAITGGSLLMKQQVIYYKDELNDEFSTAVITPKKN